ncbi:hypothetical protein TNCV_1818301 [Trichonephila clavipes]|nr:hypothetical protein TNCV_1818301 [Trichonephila clavipes]
MPRSRPNTINNRSTHLVVVRSSVEPVSGKRAAPCSMLRDVEKIPSLSRQWNWSPEQRVFYLDDMLRCHHSFPPPPISKQIYHRQYHGNREDEHEEVDTSSMYRWPVMGPIRNHM